jgi:hypothetical protein
MIVFAFAIMLIVSRTVVVILIALGRRLRQVATVCRGFDRFYLFFTSAMVPSPAARTRTALLQVRSQDVDQFLGGPRLFRSGILIRVHYVEPDMPVKDLRHQGVDRSSARGDRVEYVRAIRFALDRGFYGLNLAANSTDAIQHLLLVTNDVSQGALSSFSL